MNKNVLFSLLIGCLFLIGCSKPSGEAIRPAVIPPIQGETQTKADSTVNTTAPAGQAAIPETKDGIKPAQGDGQGDSVVD